MPPVITRRDPIEEPPVILVASNGADVDERVLYAGICLNHRIEFGMKRGSGPGVESVWLDRDEAIDWARQVLAMAEQDRGTDPHSNDHLRVVTG